MKNGFKGYKTSIRKRNNKKIREQKDARILKKLYFIRHLYRGMSAKKAEGE